MRAEYLAHMGDDLMVVNAARVSFSKWKTTFDASDKRLVRYLARHQHWTPFAHPQVQVRITAPLFVARQWFRSSVGVARNEVSRRYVSDEPGQFQPLEWRKKPEGSIKQGSGGALLRNDERVADELCAEVNETARRAYAAMLEVGVAPEQARMLLPQSTYTTWIETGSLSYFARVVKQRADAHAQAETQALARQVGLIIAPLFPISWLALMAPDDSSAAEGETNA